MLLAHRMTRLGLALLTAAAAACSSDKATAPARVEPPYVPTPPVATVPTEPQTPARLRRLDNREMENVLADALGVRLGVTRGFLPDPRVEGYTTDAVALGISESKVDELATAAERASAFIVAPANLGRLAPCPAGSPPESCAGSFAVWLTGRTWGRPADAGETTRLGEVFRAGFSQPLEGEEPYAAGIALVAQAVLQSPHFVYRTELGTPAAAGEPVRLTSTEIASQLSFVLRGGRPDDELQVAAAAGELGDAAGRERHARRLLATPESRRHVRWFLRAWLGLEQVAMINKDLGHYPWFSPRIRQALDTELETFLEHVLGQADGKLDELMTADYTFPHPVLAPIYQEDLLDPAGEHSRVRLDPRRRGLLSSPAFLALHAQIAQTNPIERGLIVRTRLFCQEVQPPPPDVLTETPTGPQPTTRGRYEAHASNPRCRGCHLMMDPIGFGFEQFDPVGRFRTTEGPHPIDARGELLGTDVDGPFVGPAELSARLVKSAQFRRCFVKQLWRFTEGRAATSADDPELDALASAFERADHRIAELLVALVKKPTFVVRRPASMEGVAP